MVERFRSQRVDSSAPRGFEPAGRPRGVQRVWTDGSCRSGESACSASRSTGLRRTLLLLALCVGLSASASPGGAAAEDLKGFWRRGDATNWRTSPVANSSRAIVYRDYPDSIDRAKRDAAAEAAEEAAAVQKARAARPEGAAAASTLKTALTTDQPLAAVPAPSEEGAPTEQRVVVNQGQPVVESGAASGASAAQQEQEREARRQQIIAKYGAPEDPRPIKASKDAPPEMQALFEAINAGDKELAFKYSLAMARRSEETAKMVSKATDYQMLAMESLGMRGDESGDPEKDAINPNRLEVREYMEKVRRERLKKKLDVDRAMGAGVSAADEEGEEAVAAVRAAEQQPIPVDPEGKVRVLVFFDEGLEETAKVAKQLRGVVDTFKGDKSVTFMGLTKRSYAVAGLKRVAAALSFPTPIINGEALGLDLRIHRYPTYVFVAATSKEKFRLDGTQAPAEIERVIRAMKGGR